MHGQLVVMAAIEPHLRCLRAEGADPGEPVQGNGQPEGPRTAFDSASEYVYAHLDLFENG